MKITIKKLLGGECSLDVSPTTYISDIKKRISGKFNMPVNRQKLLLLGQPLADEQKVQFYPTIKDGTKLNLVVQYPESLFHASITHFKRLGMSDAEAVNTTNRLLRIVQEKFNQMSWDDIDRLAMDCLLDERDQQSSNQHDPEDDMSSM